MSKNDDIDDDDQEQVPFDQYDDHFCSPLRPCAICDAEAAEYANVKWIGDEVRKEP